MQIPRCAERRRAVLICEGGLRISGDAGGWTKTIDGGEEHCGILGCELLVLCDQCIETVGLWSLWLMLDLYKSEKIGTMAAGHCLGTQRGDTVCVHWWRH